MEKGGYKVDDFWKEDQGSSMWRSWKTRDDWTKNHMDMSWEGLKVELLERNICITYD